MKLQLTQDTLDKARELAIKFSELNVSGKEHHIFKTEDNLEKKRIGYIGELTFEKYLIENNINYETDEVLYKSDKFDFKIKGKSIDIKTTYWTSYKVTDKVFLNKEQTERKQIDYYVFAVIHMDKLEILGYLSRFDLDYLSIRTDLPSPAYEITKENLKKVRDIL